jgi:replicative DNA helicase
MADEVSETVRLVLEILNAFRDSSERQRMIYQAMLRLSSDDQELNTVNLANELMKSNELEACGGLTHLIEVMDRI